MAWLLAAALQCTAFTQALPARAASALAAWAFTEEGVLKLRTSRNTRLEAFFQAASDGRGTRVWICLLYTSPSPRDRQKSRMPSSA